MRSRTGLSSTRCSTSRAARRGSRSITAAASASATRCTTARSSSPTERRRCGSASSACPPTTPVSASRGTRTPDMTMRARPRSGPASSCRWMLSARFKPYHIPLFLAKYAWLTARGKPVLVHFEVTLRCNARCSFCDYWKTHPSARAEELTSYANAARYFNPMLFTFTGGEPLLRDDLEDLVSAVAGSVRLKYIILLTHGGMLSRERARSLWDAGVNQFNISLDYLDGRHDTARGIPGLTDKILATVGAMRADGIDGIRFNTVIKRDNLDQIMPIVRHAAEAGCGVNLSVYTDSKNGNRDYLL